MPRVTSLLIPAKKEDSRKPDKPVNPDKPVKLEPTGLNDEMDFSKIFSESESFRKNVADADADDIPDLELCDE